MNKVFACFPFFNEFEILDIHLRELEDVVDTFVLVEADLTHTGHLKPFYFEAVKDIYKGRVVHRSIHLAGGPTPLEPWFNWGREIEQRRAIEGVLESMRVADDDIIVSVDVDEIVTPAVIEEYRSRRDVCAVEMPTYHYNLHTRLEVPTIDPKICRYRDFKAIGAPDLRYYPFDRLHVLKGGWHLSFMGGVKRITEKLKSYAHYDERDPDQQKYLSRENIVESIRQRKSLFMRDDVKYVEVVDPPLPRYIAEHREQFTTWDWI